MASGISSNTVKNLVLDAGAVYVNYGTVNEKLLGATRDGASFVVEQEVKEIEIDGVRGPLKGARRVISEHARITCNILEVTSDNMKLALLGTSSVTDVGTGYDTITRSIAYVADSDYLENVALVGDLQGSSNPFICIIKNALADGNLEINTSDEDEASIELQFTAHFDPSAITTSPWEIRIPKVDGVYKVTFSELNDEEGVSIQLYSNAGKTTPAGCVMLTNASGEVERYLSDGTYYYTATKSGFAVLNGTFEVDGEALTHTFTMLA